MELPPIPQEASGGGAMASGGAVLLEGPPSGRRTSTSRKNQKLPPIPMESIEAIGGGGAGASGGSSEGKITKKAIDEDNIYDVRILTNFCACYSEGHSDRESNNCIHHTENDL